MLELKGEKLENGRTAAVATAAAETMAAVTATEENGATSDQEIVVGIDEDHIKFLTSMHSGDEDSQGSANRADDSGRRPSGPDGADGDDDMDDEEDVMAVAATILSKASERSSGGVYQWESPYRCELCQRIFNRADYLRYHMRSHSNEQVFTCELCSGVFATKRDLLRHIRTEHSDLLEATNLLERITVDVADQLSCTYCDKSFQQPTQLNDHMKQHLGDKPYKCDLCRKAFIRPDFLQCHRSHHLKTQDYIPRDMNGMLNYNNGLEQSILVKRPRIALRKLADLMDDSSNGMTDSNVISRATSNGGSEEDDELREEPNRRLHQGSGRTKGGPTNGVRCASGVSLLTAAAAVSKRVKPVPPPQPHHHPPAVDESFQCPKCAVKFYTEDDLKTHFKNHTDITQFKCPLCDLVFIRSDYLKAHLKKHVEGNGEDPCAPGAINLKAFSNTSAVASENPADVTTPPPLLDVIKTEPTSPPRSVPPKPSTAAKMPTSGVSLLKPLEERKQPEQQEYCIKTTDGKFMCTVCERLFSHQQTVRIHFRTHTNEKPYKCSFCTESYIRSDYLERHLKVHFKDGILPAGAIATIAAAGVRSLAPSLGEETSDGSPAKQPVTIGRAGLAPENYHFTESNDGQYVCKICDKVFQHIGSMRKHALAHTEEKPFHCEVCDRSFNRVDYLKEHFKSKRHRQLTAEANGETMVPHLDDYEDDSTMDGSMSLSVSGGTVSGRQSKNKSPISPKSTNATPANAMTTAERSAIRLTQDGRYKCTQCEKTFVTAVTLKMHLRLHTGERPYKCGKCDKAFIRSDYLKTHEKCHRQQSFLSVLSLTSKGASSVDNSDDDGGKMDGLRRMGGSDVSRSGEQENEEDEDDEEDNDEEDDEEEEDDEDDDDDEEGVVDPKMMVDPEEHEQDDDQDDEVVAGQQYEDGEEEEQHVVRATAVPRSDDDDDENNGGGKENSENEDDEEDEDSEDEQVIEIMVKEGSSDSDEADDSDDEDNDDNDDNGEVNEDDFDRDSFGSDDGDEDDDDNLESYSMDDFAPRRPDGNIGNRHGGGYHHNGVSRHHGYEHDDSMSQPGHYAIDPSGSKGKHRCPTCHKLFAWPKSLKIHLRTHTGEKPYRCDICGKCFGRSDSLRGHKRTHGDDRLVQCHLCDVSFTNSTALVQHQHAAHGIPPLES